MSLNESGLALNLLVFLVSAVGIWFAGSALVRYADEIADRKALGRAFMGLVFLATVTELPEIATTLTASAKGNAALALNNLFGGITMQTAILAVVDGLIVRGALTYFPRKPTHALEAALLITLLTILLGFCTVGELNVGWQVGIGSITLTGAYAFSILLLRRYEAHGDWVPVELPDRKSPPPRRRASHSDSRMAMTSLYMRSATGALVILICGVLLASSAEEIAEKSALGSGFVGVTILAASTSLPELSTTIAAARLGAFSMAISNIFGSNLIMVALLLPADLVYRGGPILAEVGRREVIALLCGVLVTSIYVVGILVRRKPRVAQMGVDSIAVLSIYAGSLLLLYLMR